MGWGGWTVESVHVGFQGCYGLRKEAVGESVVVLMPAQHLPEDSRSNGTKPGWPCLAPGSAEAEGGVNVHWGGERAVDRLVTCLYYPLEPRPVCHGAAAIPYCDLRTLRKCSSCGAFLVTAVA